jgi:hypothetical protein
LCTPRILAHPRLKLLALLTQTLKLQLLAPNAFSALRR